MGSFSLSLSEKVGCELLLCFIHADVTPGGKKSDGFADAVCHLNSEGGYRFVLLLSYYFLREKHHSDTG